MQGSTGRRVLMLLENDTYRHDPRVRGEASALTAAGYHVAVICQARPGGPRRELVDGVRVYGYPPPPEFGGALGYLWEYAYSLVATFAISLVVAVRDGFDIVHLHNPPDLFAFVAAFYKAFGKQFVFDHHDLAPEMYRARFGGDSKPIVHHGLVWLERFACRLADHVIATNESYKRMEMERGRVPERRITIVRNGPELDRFRAAAPDPHLRRKAATIIGYVGVLGRQDGVDYLLRALRHVIYSLGRRDVFCVVIGKGDALPWLRRLAAELGVADYVWFTGWVSEADLLRYLSTVDICVDPDPSNSFNDRCTMIKMMEYMALAKPIVAFDLPEHRVTAQAAALYVRPNDEREFASALAQLMDDPARRAAMGALGRQRVETELEWRYSIPNLLDAYRRLLSERREMPPMSRRGPAGWIARFARPKRRSSMWATPRVLPYLAARSIALLGRYGVTSTKAKRRIRRCVAALARYDCRPTFPTPGRVVSGNAEFCRDVQRSGAELAVHGYDHVDFGALPQAEAEWQLMTAAQAFRVNGIEFEGFRCPYLSCPPESCRSVADGLFDYSSNRAIWWDVVPAELTSRSSPVFDQLNRIYRADAATVAVAMPKTIGGLVEIPAALPDDLQLVDGLKLGAEGARRVWIELLRRIHQRGELFVVLFHPETFERCRRALEGVLEEADRLRPAVWKAQLRDVSRWWREKSRFAVDLSPAGAALRIRFDCSERATVLVRGLELSGPRHAWHGAYSVLETRAIEAPREPRPLIGLAPDLPPAAAAFLSEQGYLLDTSDQAPGCGIYLTPATLATLAGEVALIEYIEASAAPLVRYWRWPDAARCALCVSGDLDAVSLLDYAVRLAPGRRPPLANGGRHE